MSKIAIGVLIFILAVACNGDANTDQSTHGTDSTTSRKSDTAKKSIPAKAEKWVGNTDVKINYHAPGVRGRTIWGGLVPYDEVWVTGAHSATTLEIGKDFKAGDKTIPEGKYALFTIPGKENWTIIINKNWDQHLVDEYSAEDDLVRVSVKPEALLEVVERLKFEIDQKGERLADILISWEKIKVVLPIEIL